MEIKNRLRNDLWKAVYAHYEGKDYTESVRDAMLYVCEFLREKSGIIDKDGTKLVENTLFGNSPVILVNKNETTTEKDVQQGTGFLLKGLMQAIRNPLSHEKTTYLQNDSEAIILFVNYVLNQIDSSGGRSKIDSLKDLIYDANFTSSKEYAELLIKEIPVKKRYDLLLDLYRDRESLTQNKLKNFLDELMNSLSSAEFSDFIQVVTSSLMICQNDRDLRMYFHYFMESTYSHIDRLAQLRIENLIYDSIKYGEIENKFDFELREETEECNSQGTLGTWIDDKLYLLSNKEQILDKLFMKLGGGNSSEQKYVLTFFCDCVFNSSVKLTDYRKNIIKDGLKNGDKQFSDNLFCIMTFEEKSTWYESFKDDYELCCEKNKKEDDEELPF